ncbi:MAG TPA: DUF4915 domain-containing protein, partial [Lacipirellulaceae bacterium]|nr:DUF4915 domain-containing protein [Lacipirellulaceae bacterium]
MTDQAANADGAGANGLELRVHGDFVAWLAATAGCLAATTYNAGKLALIAAPQGALVVQVVRLQRPMGVAYSAGMLAVALRCKICQWSGAAPGPGRSTSAPTLLAPAASHETGRLDVHDLAFDAEGLVFANTRFNCVARPSPRAKFRRHWTPPFMEPSRSLPRDCCHLNGIGVRDGRVELATTFGLDWQPGSWRREDRWTSGALLATRSGDVVARGLCMPHSPRWDGARWWLCNSGQGTLATLDPAARQFRDVATLPGFTRGLAFAAGRAGVGLSH